MRECDFYADLNSKSNMQRVNEVRKIIEDILRNIISDKNLLDRLSNLKFEISKRERITAYLISNYKIPSFNFLRYSSNPFTASAIPKT